MRRFLCGLRIQEPRLDSSRADFVCRAPGGVIESFALLDALALVADELGPMGRDYLLSTHQGSARVARLIAAFCGFKSRAVTVCPGRAARAGSEGVRTGCASMANKRQRVKSFVPLRRIGDMVIPYSISSSVTHPPLSLVALGFQPFESLACKKVW